MLSDYSEYVTDLMDKCEGAQRRLHKIYMRFGLTLLVACGVYVTFQMLAYNASSGSTAIADARVYSRIGVVLPVALMVSSVFIYIPALSMFRDKANFRESLDQGIEKLAKIIGMASQFDDHIEKRTEQRIYMDLALSRAELILRRAQSLK